MSRNNELWLNLPEASKLSVEARRGIRTLCMYDAMDRICDTAYGYDEEARNFERAARAAEEAARMYRATAHAAYKMARDLRANLVQLTHDMRLLAVADIEATLADQAKKGA